MKQLLNSLYVTTPKSYIHRDGMNLVVSVEDDEIGRIPINNIQSLVCFGYMGISPAAMELCVDNNVSISIMTPYGKYQASIQGTINGNVLLRREQFRIADSENISLSIAKNIVEGKILNCRSLLRRGKNDHGDKIDVYRVTESIERLTDSIQRVKTSDNPGTLRAVEGEAAKAYFSGFDELIVKQKNDFFMRSRNRRPPTDNMNSLLSFLYSLLASDTKSSLESVGLDPYVGFYHVDRPGRPSLALDLMEELRPVMADRLALSLVNLRLISGEGFIEKESGGIIMTDETRKEVIRNWQERKTESYVHPYLKEKLNLGLIPYAQSMLMARFIRKDIDGYPPFIMRRSQ